MKKFFLGILALTFLVSCNDNEQNYQIPNSFSDIATVDNPNQSSGFYFKLDNNDKMWITLTGFPYYKPKTGQRIIASYSILSTADKSNLYSHKVQLNDVYEVLTKSIFKVTSTNQDSIGNDPVQINDMWIGSDYLNVEFQYPGFNQIHFINLVSDNTKTYTDGKVHLEFRHNANNDSPSYSKWGIVSFDISSLKTNAIGDSVNLVIHTKVFRTPQDQTYNLTYKFGTASPLNVRGIMIPKDKIKIE